MMMTDKVSVGNNKKKVLNTPNRMLSYMTGAKKSPIDSSQDLFLALRFIFSRPLRSFNFTVNSFH